MFFRILPGRHLIFVLRVRTAKQRLVLWLHISFVIPDMDVLIRSASDPLLAIEYHRHFTHALAFIPVGGLIAAAMT